MADAKPDSGRIKANIAHMISLGAPEADIDAYVKSEGVTPEELRTHTVMQYIDDAVRSIANGMTGGAADKLAAAMNSLMGSGNYEQNLRQERQQTASISPAISVPGQIAGAIGTTALVAPAAGAIGAATGLAKLPGIVRATGAGAIAGAAQGAGESDNVTLGDVAKGAAIGGAGGAVLGTVLGGAGKLLGALGDKITTSVIRPTARDIADGFSLDTIKQFNLGGSLNTTYNKTQALLGDLSNQLRDKLSQSKATIDLPTIVEQTRNELSSAAGKLKGFGANQKINAALDSLTNEAQLVGNRLSIPDAQLVKQAAGSFGAWQYGRPDPESKASEIVFNAFYNKLKTAIENASPIGVKEINQQLAKLIPVNNALIRRMPVADRNYALSLGDLVALAASTAHPSGLALTGLNLAQKSGAVGNVLSKAGSISGATPSGFAGLSGLGGNLIPQSQPQQ